MCRISNGHIAAQIYLTDAQIGHYRGPRFDWSGMIDAVEVNGHRFFGPFKPGEDNPEAHDDNATGPAEEYGFSEPLGYSEAAAGETFLKIGVGTLRKPADETAYAFNSQYEIERPGSWSVRYGADFVEFQQTLQGDRGWGYEYRKRIELPPGKPQLLIRHMLRNIGTKTISTDQYCHNLFRFDDQSVSPGYQIVLPFPATFKDTTSLSRVARSEGNRVTLFAALQPKQSMHAECTGLRGIPEDYAATVSNGSCTIHMRGDRTPVKYKIFALATVICVEPFIEIDLRPGEEMTWTVTYEFDTPKQSWGET